MVLIYYSMFTTWKLAEHETNTKLDALKAETEGHDVNDAFAETQGGQVFAVSDEETLLQARRKVLVDTMKGKGEAKYASKQHEVCTNHSGLTAEVRHPLHHFLRIATSEQDLTMWMNLAG